MKSQVFIATLCLITSVQLFADWSEAGLWVSNNGNADQNVFNFAANNKFHFATRGGDIETTIVVLGNWEYQPELCWTDELRKTDRKTITSKTLAKGNLTVRFPRANTVCCLHAERLGENLILSKVWVEGDAPHISEICANSVLSRSKKD